MNSKPYFTQTEAEEIMELISEKLKSDTTKQKGIRAKIRNRGFWASDYGLRDGYTVNDFLRVAKIVGGKTLVVPTPEIQARTPVKLSIEPIKIKEGRNQSDESYVIDLCDEVLKQKALRQYRFDFLKGDAGTKLPVDAWYPDLKLVVEFRERQHTEEVKFFDRRETVSGVGRGEQRKLYDQKRRDVLPEHGITLIELGYDDFKHRSNNKLIRDREEDLIVVKEALGKFLK
jgi:hypothetical protein